MPHSLRPLSPARIHTADSLVEMFGEHFVGQTPTPTGKSGRCFANAQGFARSHPSTRYFEGLASPNAACKHIRYAHAWCVDIQGHVLDPTWQAPEASYLGVEIPLAQLGWDAVQELVRYSDDGSLLHNYGYGDPLLCHPWPLSAESIARLRTSLDNLQGLPSDLQPLEVAFATCSL